MKGGDNSRPVKPLSFDAKKQASEKYRKKTARFGNTNFLFHLGQIPRRSRLVA
jgi:hypothetical protein